MVGSGLLVRAFWNLQQVDAGIRPGSILTARVSLTTPAYRDATRLRDFWIRLNQELQRMPGVISATLAFDLPPERVENDNDTDIENFVPRTGGPIQNVAFYQTTGDRFFETIGARLISGRFFDDRDGDGAPAVAIVNEKMAKTFWPGESAAGKRIRPSGDKVWRRVVGVVGDIRNFGLNKSAGTEIFFPARQLNNATQTLFAIVRTSGDPAHQANLIRQTARTIDPSVPVSSIRTMDEVFRAAESRPKFLAIAMTIFSSLALALAAFGIYGVISYSVARRTVEFGIRMALGAGRGQVLKMVIGEGAVLAVAGLGLGCLGAVTFSRVMAGLLFNVSPFDVLTFTAMGAILALVSIAACCLPARRATTVDPMRALRYE